ncbi:MAG: rRNA maturation RNase YbeY [Melioribacteraceae bacterium]|nr:rRNA maturation RNase YbeY [Melioribacteraceae bacterium]
MKNLRVETEEQYSINKQNVHHVISRLKKELKFSISFLQINFVSSQHIKFLNEEYLEHKGSTDIITFNYSSQNYILDAESYICIKTAEENAKSFNITVQNELIRLIIHGILHLTGYDDINESDRKKMQKEENRLVDLIFHKDIKILENDDK